MLCLQENKAGYFLLWKDKSDEKLYNLTLGKQTNWSKIPLTISSATQGFHLQFNNEKNFYTYILQAYSKACITYFTIILKFCIKVMYNNSGKQPRITEYIWMNFMDISYYSSSWNNKLKLQLQAYVLHTSSKATHNISAIWSF